MSASLNPEETYTKFLGVVISNRQEVTSKVSVELMEAYL